MTMVQAPPGSAPRIRALKQIGFGSAPDACVKRWRRSDPCHGQPVRVLWAQGSPELRIQAGWHLDPDPVSQSQGLAPGT